MSLIKLSPILQIPQIKGKKFTDKRGFFSAILEPDLEKELGIKLVQLNHSSSKKHVIRGLHYQLPHMQGKLVYIVKGKVLDVVVDIRRGSPTFGKHETFVLDHDSHSSIYIPPGFAHGFLALSDVDFLYGITESGYHPESEQTIIWNDPDLDIKWNEKDPIISDKDFQGKPLRELDKQNALPTWRPFE